MSTPDPVRAALADLQDAIDCEGFGCACMPAFRCGTCKARDVLDRSIRKPFEKLRAALAAQPAEAAALTDAQIVEIAESCGYDGAVPTVRLAFHGFKLWEFARAIERAIKGKP